MAWSHNASFPIATSNKTSGSSISYPSVGPNVSAGDFVIVCVAKDNTQTTDGETSEVTSVTDSSGTNTYTKLKEFTNGQGAANGGATISLWGCVLATALTGGSGWTANLSGSVTAKAIMIDVYSIGAGSSVTVEGSATLANDNADPGSMTISGLTSQEYLFFRAIACENDNTGLGITPTTNYTGVSATGAGTTGGGNASNMSIKAERRIFTGTGDTSDPTANATFDCASVYVALKEASAGARTLACATGSYSISGTAAALKMAHVLPATTAGYTITGSAATLAKGRPIAAAPGTYTITGTAAAFNRTYVLAAASGSYVISGTAALVEFGRKLVAAAGSYLINGTAAAFPRGKQMVAAAGSYAITGATVALLFAHNLVAAAGSYVISGTAANFARAFQAASGSYVITGTTATFGRAFQAASGSYAITGSAAAFRRTATLAASAGSYVVTGSSAVLALAKAIIAAAGSYIFTGANAVLSATQAIWTPTAAASGSWSDSGSASGIWTPTSDASGTWS